MGDLTLRLLARAGIRGRVGFDVGCWVSLDLFGAGMVWMESLFMGNYTRNQRPAKAAYWFPWQLDFLFEFGQC